MGLLRLMSFFQILVVLNINNIEILSNIILIESRHASFIKYIQFRLLLSDLSLPVGFPPLNPSHIETYSRKHMNDRPSRSIHGGKTSPGQEKTPLLTQLGNIFQAKRNADIRGNIFLYARTARFPLPLFPRSSGSCQLSVWGFPLLLNVVRARHAHNPYIKGAVLASWVREFFRFHFHSLCEKELRCLRGVRYNSEWD